MKKLILLFICILWISQISAQNTEWATFEKKIEWITFEEAIDLNKENPKQLLIDIYTDWCGYCKKMDRNTYENKVIIKLINENFYAVKLNAEQKEALYYKGKEYVFINNGRRGYNEFAANLLQGKMSYPSTVFMDKSENILQKIPGYLTPEIMEPILVYLSKEKHLEQPWEDFQKEFISKL